MLQSGVSHCSLIFPASFSFFLTSVLKLFFRIKAKNIDAYKAQKQWQEEEQ